MKFSEINIEGLRGVGNVELRLDQNQRVFTFFGTNGVGKTKCLEAIFAGLVFQNRIFKDHVIDSKLAIKSEAVVANSVSVNGQLTLKSHECDEQSLFKANYWHSIDTAHLHDTPVIFLGASHRAFISTNQSKVEQLGDFENRKLHFFSQIGAAISLLRFSTLGMADDLRSWVVARAHSVNPYQKLSDNKKVEIDTWLEMLSTLDTRINRDYLQIDAENLVFIKISGEVRELSQLSSGFASLVKMMQAIISGYAAFTNETNLTHVRGIVFIDEIESHLHLEWQSKIVLLLKKMLPNTTFFIATHSPLVLTQLEDGEAYQLVRDPNDGVVRSDRIKSPNKQALIDILREGFGVDLNALKRERMSAETQQAAKAQLLSLLDGSEPQV